MLLTIVVAADDHNVIGHKNTMLWSLPDDFKRMKELTMGKPLIMGRKTHESIGRVLPGRTNIVITRDSSQVLEGAIPANSLEQAIAIAKGEGATEAIIFGGGEVYRQALPITDRVHLTRVHGVFEGDTTFPELSPEEWRMVRSEKHEADERHTHAFTFEDYERTKK